jgi:hypothetical protein
MPGAGSLQAANYLYAQAPKDGTAWGVVTQTIVLERSESDLAKLSISSLPPLGVLRAGIDELRHERRY